MFAVYQFEIACDSKRHACPDDHTRVITTIYHQSTTKYVIFQDSMPFHECNKPREPSEQQMTEKKK